MANEKLGGLATKVVVPPKEQMIANEKLGGLAKVVVPPQERMIANEKLGEARKEAASAREAEHNAATELSKVSEDG